MIPIHFSKYLILVVYHFSGYLVSSVGRKGQKKRELQAQWLLKFFVRMGPVYVKIGQVMATRSDFMPDEWVQILRTLQDNVPHMNEKQTRLSINNNISRPFDEVFSDFDFHPIASASIAQVHRATLADGKKVAVKVVKKNVRKNIENSIRVIKLFVNAGHFMLPSIRQLELPKRLHELSILLTTQTDMEQEAERQESIHSNFKGHTYVKVPVLHRDLCTNEMLVMEFMEGTPGKKVHELSFSKERLAQRLQDTIYTMLYMHGLCHGDPHPGNMFFTDDGEIILLDFGITVDLSENEKWGLSSFYYACTRKEWDIATKRFTEHFVTDKATVYENWDQYAKEIEVVLKHHFDENSTQWSTISYFKDINNVLKKYKAKYSPNFTKVELVFLSCEGFATQINPNIDIWQNARLFTDRYSPYMSPEVKQNFDEFFKKKMPTSLAMRDLSKSHLVAPTHIDRYFFPSTYPIFVKTAYQGKFVDLDDNEYVDLSGGYGPHILGYSHPAITAALNQGVSSGLVNAIGNQPELNLARTIVDAFPAAEKAVLCNSGTESVLMAIRLCRAYRKRDRVVKFEGHYHGWSDQGMVSSWFRFTGPKYSPHPISGTQGSDKNTVDNTLILQYGHIEGLERIREQAEELGCVICEPLPSSVAKCDVEFLKALRDICTELGVPLIFDEVVTGFRVAYGGAQTLVGVSPDLTCLGKIIGGGLPCGCVVGKKELIDIAKSSEDPFFDYENKAFVGGTMSGNSLTCSAGLAALTYLKEHQEVYKNLEENTAWLADTFSEKAKSYGIPFRISARHSIFSLTFSYKSSKFYRDKMTGSNFKANVALAYYMRKHGVYMPELHSFLLSAAHTPQDLELTGQAFDSSLKEMVDDGIFVT